VSDIAAPALISRRTFLVIEACREGATWPLAVEAVATYALAHPEVDMGEYRTYDEWRRLTP
jgi:hypothetical protein